VSGSVAVETVDDATTPAAVFSFTEKHATKLAEDESTLGAVK
jgi:hypothetical protein